MGGPKYVEPLPDMSGKTAIITGSNVGIGYATALYLASLNCRVVLACRTQHKAEDAVKSIQEQYPDTQVEWMPLDLQSLESARHFVQKWAVSNASTSDEGKVDLLICNGGATFLDLKRTNDGFEQTYQTNYLTHFLLVRLMLDYLRRSEAARIILVSSNAASWGQVALDNLNAENIPESNWKGFSRFKTGMQVYGNSKLMQMLSVLYIQKLLQQSTAHEKDKCISIHAVYPGFVASDMGKKDHYGLSKYVTTPLNGLLRLAARSTVNGAKPTLWAALSEEGGDPAKNGASYFNDNCVKTAYPNKQCADDSLMKNLYERSCRDVGIEIDLL